MNPTKTRPTTNRRDRLQTDVTDYKQTRPTTIRRDRRDREDADDLHVQSHTRHWPSRVQSNAPFATMTLSVHIWPFRWRVKTHLPRRRLRPSVVASHIRQSEERTKGYGHMYVETCWPNFPTQVHASGGVVNVNDSAFGDFFNVLGSSSLNTVLHPQFDSSASWWTQTFGHTNTRLTLAAAQAAGRYGHVMFARATHAPALTLSEHLLSPNGPGHEWASKKHRNGTRVEDGIEDIFNKRRKRTYERRLGVIGLKGSYHGDTIGNMDACEESESTRLPRASASSTPQTSPSKPLVSSTPTPLNLSFARWFEDPADTALESVPSPFSVPQSEEHLPGADDHWATVVGRQLGSQRHGRDTLSHWTLTCLLSSTHNRIDNNSTNTALVMTTLLLIICIRSTLTAKEILSRSGSQMFRWQFSWNDALW
ncbi:hypothetical protein F5880DRAFT_1687820 [Lentinula raphanica]|nr:hypothetical protein F5880DRAFT_1687820 [Lentinula raphanica]